MKTGRPSEQSRGLPVITLLTDFGTADYFTGALKGVVLSLNSSAVIADITHEIPSHDVEAAAFILLASYRSFPDKTIHVAVVDPGVGSSRRPILVSGGGQFFVGPDNGIFSYIYESEPVHQTIHLTEEQYFRHPVSATFHGRDIFAPVAAALSKGINPTSFGTVVTDEVRLEPLRPGIKGSKVLGRILHIDRFGNCITNINHENLSKEKEPMARLLVNGKTIKRFKTFFEEERERENIFAIWGSAGFLEIAASNRSAAELLNAKRGQAVTLTVDP